MNILNPLALLFALLAVPIVLLYLLRLQRREQSVSSTLLWRQSTLDREANALWQKLRPNILLFLQLLTLAFLVFALIRPYINQPGQTPARTIVLLDASASMLAEDVPPTRFSAAKKQVSNLIDDLGANDQLALILMGASPRALSGFSASKAELAAALDAAQPALEAANWGAAISLAQAIAQGDENTAFVVVSDGANADDAKLLTGNVKFIPVGVNGENVFISAFTVRRTVRGLAAFVRVNNSGKSAASVLVSLRSGDALLDARTLDVPAAGSATWTQNDLDPALPHLTARIDQTPNAAQDNLAADDAAYAINPVTSIRRALLVTRGNRFLEQALGALPGLQVTRVVPSVDGLTAGQDLSGAVYDLIVLDNITATLPSNANVLMIGAGAQFSSTGVFSNTGFVRAEASPIAQNVDWRGVNVLEAQHLAPPAWLQPVIQAQGGGLVFAGDGASAGLGRVVALPFDLFKSDLPLQIAFPVLVANSVDWLSPAQGLALPASVKPGEVIALPGGSQVVLPAGASMAAPDGVFADTAQPGIYAVQTPRGRGYFAVNFLDARESDTTPQPNLQFANANAQTQTAQGLSQRELWNILAALALVLLTIEWWVYQRGLRTRKA